MNLWIRSQDKMKLVSNCNLYISDELRKEFVIEDLNNKYLKLGTYQTKERALAVLDEIEKAILCTGGDKQELETLKIDFKSFFATNTKTGIAIYEMPYE